jgi:O-antigen/teichoic acid export membrane protein
VPLPPTSVSISAGHADVPDHRSDAGRTSALPRNENARGMTEDNPPSGHRSHLAGVARGGVINLAGAVVGGLLGFVLVVVITNDLGPRGSGAFFVAIAMFSLLSNTLELGADTGSVRTISRYLALGRVRDLRQSLFVAVVPVFVASAIAAVIMYLFAPQLASLFTNHDPEMVLPLVRILALFLPIAAPYTVFVAATRGFGTMVPTVVIDRLGKPALQPLLVVLVFAAGLGLSMVVLAWALPIALSFVAAALWLRVLLRRAEADPAPAVPSSSLGALGAEFWRFAAPRGLAGFFQVAILWVDTLLLGALRSTREAGIYAAATRYMLVGSFAILAILQVMGPKMSELIAKKDHDAAQSVYQVLTSWLILMTWPIYFTIILFAPVLLSVFGKGFGSGDAPLVILGCAMLVATAAGPVDVVLLMAGKSSWNLVNTLIALTLNIGLNLLLIPPFGITGAAIAWAVSIFANNLIPLVQDWVFLGLHPFGRGFPRAMACATLAYGALGLLIRMTMGPTLAAFIVFILLSTITYLAMLWWLRGALDLGVLRDALRGGRRRAGVGDPAAPTQA